MKNSINVDFIERLRQAAAEHGAVAELLDALNGGLLLDGSGNKEIVAEGDALELIENALIAAEFTKFDRRGE